MSDVIYLVQGDTKPQVKATLTRDDGTAQDVTGATIKLHFRPALSTTLSFSANWIWMREIMKVRLKSFTRTQLARQSLKQ